ncbi:MAG: phosphodiester glycosidase family protein [Armatimonadota bacterium]|nr:phosphodiester glycosidase family protein [Armatimonadota bacterium]MDR7401891.1 phosphodiester glycosidase family protein [Armatimonadota bacterium]MDR7404528.1 phosphodiester glycosidase family protein [Armatimonadota bacterium]MDR7436902.1 phosphodiester glycosidase family protein [Armatimonadota bacterium]MDR7471558.1 phosphodiester glycosidase family protein [Armatimonadota bacterium]
MGLRAWISHPAVILAAALAVGLPAAAADVRIAGATAVAWVPEGPLGRVLIRLAGSVAYRTLGTHSSITVDLWQARYPPEVIPVPSHPYVRQVQVDQMTPDLARVRIHLRRPARYRAYLMSDPPTLAVVVIPPWMATVPLPPSVAYQALRARAGRDAVTVHVLRVDPHDPAIEVRPVLAADMVSGRETTSIIATRYRALAAVNGGYFAGPGMPLGMVAVDGQLVSAPLPRRSVLALPARGRPMIRDFQFRGRLVARPDLALPVTDVNRPPRGGGIAVFTPHYGPLTPPAGLAAVVRHDIVERLPSGRVLIPRDGYVLVVNALDAPLLAHLRPGQRVVLDLQVTPDLEVVAALGGGPRLVKDGQVSVPYMWEQFSPALVQRRAPRTAVGVTSAGTLLLVTVDGRGRRHTGMTLFELAELMARLGAREAMNLDGGGSATMVVGGRVVNDPSDGVERPVASALLVLRRN